MMATDAADGHVTGPDAVDKNAIFAGANLVAQADEDGREITHAIWRRHSKLVSSVAAPDDADLANGSRRLPPFSTQIR